MNNIVSHVVMPLIANQSKNLEEFGLAMSKFSSKVLNDEHLNEKNIEMAARNPRILDYCEKVFEEKSDKIVKDLNEMLKQ